MNDLEKIINDAWNKKEQVNQNSDEKLINTINQIIEDLDKGKVRVAEKINGEWITHQHIKKAIMLSFRIHEMEILSGPYSTWYDKAHLIKGKTAGWKKEDFIKSTDICEVWFDSGSTHSFVLEKRDDLKWPASMYLEGSDQHRGWFHSSLLESCGTRGRAPYESILSHGFVVDGKGLKMSKSTGNIISPEDILKKYGADILRVWVAASDYAEDLRIDFSILDQHAESYRKIRNTFRFLLGNLRDQKTDFNFSSDEVFNWPALEKYMLHKIYILNQNFKSYFREYSFHKLYKDLLNFCSQDLSAFYFDIRKDTLYCDGKESQTRKVCINFLNILLDSLLKWFAPILSFTTEEIYKIVNKNETDSIHLKNFPNIPRAWQNDQLFKRWSELNYVRQVCNAAIEVKRSNKELGSSLEADLEIYLDDRYLKLAKEFSSSGDRIQSEYYYQFTDHYYRLMLELGITLEDNETTQDNKISSDVNHENQISNENNNEKNDSEVNDFNETSDSDDVDSIESIPFMAEPAKKKSTKAKKASA